MKNVWAAILLLFTLLGCDTDDQSINQYNPYLINPQVNIIINLNLPQYSDLNFPGGSAIITSQGVRGIVVYRLNEDLFTAFELADPNHIANDCSRMTINGIEASCPCPNEDKADNLKKSIMRSQQRNDREGLYPVSRALFDHGFE